MRAYARLLAASGVNAVAVNNVNVHATEARLLTDRLGDVAEIADVLRPYGIRVHLSVSFAAPVVLGGLPTADPLRRGGAGRGGRRPPGGCTQRIPDFGGYVVKADSEGQPGPFAYGRSHADGANVLADALAPHGGVVHWRAFVYNHRQDWRDRSTDRARAAYDHFAPLDGQFRDNVILQVKHGPMDFQTREPVSPVHRRDAGHPAGGGVAGDPGVHRPAAARLLPRLRCGARCWASGPGARRRTVADVAAGGRARGGGLVAVSNVGDDPFWTGHPLAQANLYAFGRLAWDPRAGPGGGPRRVDRPDLPAAGHRRTRTLVRRTLHAMMDDSWRTYERYTAPLGVGFMVQPGDHYGPDVDGYEYTPVGHLPLRRPRRRRAWTGPGPPAPASPASTRRRGRRCTSRREQCPDELLLFFHHVPVRARAAQRVDRHPAHLRHPLRRGRGGGGDAASGGGRSTGLIDPAVYDRVAERLDEQVRCAIEWRDQINTYFFRKSGVPDAHGRRIY